MKRMLFALFVLFLTTACFRSHLNSPGLTAEGLSPKLPSPAYGQLENDSKSLDYNYLLANKELDYEMTKYNMVMDYELKMKMAWQACLKQESEQTCMMIHGGWPYYMSYMGAYGYGYPYTAMPGFYPGCPYQDASYCMTYFETMQYMQTQGVNLGAAYQTSTSQEPGPQYAVAVAEVEASDKDEDLDKKLARLEELRNELLGTISDVKPLLEKVASSE